MKEHEPGKSPEDNLPSIQEPLENAEESLAVAEESLQAAKESLQAAEESLAAEKGEEPPHPSTPGTKPQASLPSHPPQLALPPHPATPEKRRPMAPPPIPSSSKKESSFRLGPILIGLAVVAVIVALVLIPRFMNEKSVRQDTDTMAVPTVTVLHPKPGEADVEISLPGNVQAYYDAPIYARTSGYLKRWMFDIGAHVKAGQVLAEIESPEVDQELDQARAAVAQTEASLALAQSTAVRWRDLMKQNAVSQQELDEKNGDLSVQQANLAANQANVKRLEAMVSFEKVVAPFDGVVTARQTDIGALINAGSGTGAGPELFHMAQTDRLRVYVNVPEVDASSVTLGTEARVVLTSSPNVPATGKVTHTAGAIDPNSRTLLVQLEVPNADGKLFPGGYAQVHFHVTLAQPPLIVPINTLLFRATGSMVGVVGPNHTVTLRKVKIGRDFGNSVEIVDGLSPKDSVILNPADSLQDGLTVRVQEQKAAPEKKS